MPFFSVNEKLSLLALSQLASIFGVCVCSDPRFLSPGIDAIRRDVDADRYCLQPRCAWGSRMKPDGEQREAGTDPEAAQRETAWKGAEN